MEHKLPGSLVGSEECVWGGVVMGSLLPFPLLCKCLRLGPQIYFLWFNSETNVHLL